MRDKRIMGPPYVKKEDEVRSSAEMKIWFKLMLDVTKVCDNQHGSNIGHMNIGASWKESKRENEGKHRKSGIATEMSLEFLTKRQICHILLSGMRSRVYIGMGGWDLPPFDEFFYPPRIGNGFRKLEFYSRYFDFVEINSTFYSTSLRPRHALRWLSDVSGNPSFIFTVKLFRGFTHTLNALQSDLHATFALLDTLKGRNKLHGQAPWTQ